MSSNNTTFSLISDYLNAFKNSSTDDGHLQQIVKNIIESSKDENRLQMTVLTNLLGFFSIFGTLSNLSVILIFSFNMKKLKRRNNNFTQRLNQQPSTAQAALTNSMFFQQTFQYSFSNLQRFYSLIKYLAMIDLFTCSVSIPSTIFEIWHDKQINEVFCKLFEQFRATGNC